jgi:hypothetical protein
VSDEAAPFEAQLVVPPVRNGECKKWKIAWGWGGGYVRLSADPHKEFKKKVDEKQGKTLKGLGKRGKITEKWELKG